MKLTNLSYLKYFYDAALHGSVVRSAQINLITQTAVSHAIKKLEQLLDAQLLNHQKRSFQLTEEGILIFQKCDAIFNAVQSLEEDIGISKNEVSGFLRFATSQSLAVSIIPPHLQKYQKKFPAVTPQMMLGKSLLIKQWVLEGLVEFGILVEKGASSQLETKPLRKGEFVFVASSLNAKHSFLVTEERNEVNQIQKAYEKKYGTSFSVGMCVESWSVIKSFAQRGLGIGVIPDFIGTDGLKILDLGLPKVHYDIVAVYSKRSPLNRRAKLFLDLLAD